MNKLKIWWIPNPLQEAFEREVSSIEEAILLLNFIADYDLYLGDDLISSNAGGLQEFVDGEWVEYQSPQGYSVDDFMDEPELLDEYKQDLYFNK